VSGWRREERAYKRKRKSERYLVSSRTTWIVLSKRGESRVTVMSEERPG
jgi:hypothetical protein